MRLSEAIRLGSMLKPQAFGDLWVDGKSCALGAAYDALGCGADAPLEPLPSVVRMSLELGLFSCPGCNYRRVSLGFVISHLNDSHRWTREQIADWVATVEQGDSEPTVDHEPTTRRSAVADPHLTLRA